MPQIFPMNWLIISLLLFLIVMLMKMKFNNSFKSKPYYNTNKKMKKIPMKW